MTTAIKNSHPVSPALRPKVSDALEKSASEQFAQLFVHAYLEASQEVQGVIQSMAKIISDPEADPDDKESALDTLIEALFPTNHNGDLGIDIDDLRQIAPDEIKSGDYKVQDDEEQSFSERLKQKMEQSNTSVSELAIRIGVGQSAVSMMLGRQCRPQRATVKKIAEALKVKPEELWPTFKE